MSGWFVARIHGQGPAEQINVYNLETAVAPHVYNNDRRYAVLVVDMLHDFVYGKIKCDRAVPMIPRSVELIDSARSAGVPVLYSNDSHTKKDFEIERWGEHAMRGTKGDRKSTRLNSSHDQISYAVFCLKKKKIKVDREELPHIDVIYMKAVQMPSHQHGRPIIALRPPNRKVALEGTAYTSRARYRSAR